MGKEVQKLIDTCRKCKPEEKIYQNISAYLDSWKTNNRDEREKHAQAIRKELGL